MTVPPEVEVVIPATIEELGDQSEIDDIYDPRYLGDGFAPGTLVPESMKGTFKM